MTMADISEEVFWLAIANALLGISTLAFGAIIVWHIWRHR